MRHETGRANSMIAFLPCPTPTPKMSCFSIFSSCSVHHPTREHSGSLGREQGIHCRDALVDFSVECRQKSLTFRLPAHFPQPHPSKALICPTNSAIAVASRTEMVEILSCIVSCYGTSNKIRVYECMLGQVAKGSLGVYILAVSCP